MGTKVVGGKWGVTTNRLRTALWDDENILKLIIVMVALNVP